MYSGGGGGKTIHKASFYTNVLLGRLQKRTVKLKVVLHHASINDQSFVMFYRAHMAYCQKGVQHDAFYLTQISDLKTDVLYKNVPLVIAL